MNVLTSQIHKSIVFLLTQPTWGLKMLSQGLSNQIRLLICLLNSTLVFISIQITSYSNLFLPFLLLIFVEKYTAKSVWLHTIAILWSKSAIFRGAWQNVGMLLHPWAPTALIPHFRAFKRGILHCCISRGSKVMSFQSLNVYILHHFP